ncbi:MAG TPA: DUF3047 domain-containing protein [Casimicrobium huifangae]|nr:DUF3047 domain-containing protein [Casimicrobium huifangae]
MLLVSACTQMPSPVVEPPVDRTDRFTLPNDAMVAPWHAVNMRFKTPTTYSTGSMAGVPCIHASSNAAWSFWVAHVPSAFADRSTLSWRWFIPAAIPDADPSAIGKDDAPARVVVSFKGDRSKLDAAERATMSLARALGGLELPYAAIQYIWDAKTEPETILPNSNTSRIKKLVVKRGPDGLADWQSFSRDVRADFRRAFPGEEPGEIEGVGLMTDTDSLGGKAEACYADVSLR